MKDAASNDDAAAPGQAAMAESAVRSPPGGRGASRPTFSTAFEPTNAIASRNQRRQERRHPRTWSGALPFAWAHLALDPERAPTLLLEGNCQWPERLNSTSGIDSPAHSVPSRSSRGPGFGWSGGLVSGQDDEFAGGASGFHVGVRRCDVVVAVGAMDRHDGVAGRDRVEEVLEDLDGEVSGVSAVGGKADPARQLLDRVEVVHGPLVGEHPGEANDPADPGRSQRVREGWGADQFECGIDAVGEDHASLVGEVAVVDEDVVDTDAAEGVGPVGVAGGG